MSSPCLKHKRNNDGLYIHAVLTFQCTVSFSILLILFSPISYFVRDIYNGTNKHRHKNIFEESKNNIRVKIYIGASG